MNRMRRWLLITASWILCACSGVGPQWTTSRSARPSILLVTLDTTRADAIGHGADRANTDAMDAIAATGLTFRQAYAPVPETLPAHTSMLTGLYPAGHGIHENARYLSSSFPVVAKHLQRAGYRTAAFVSAFVLDRRFGLARGFDVYDDGGGTWTERNARDTTDAAIAELRTSAATPRFLWVHYYDAHAPYAAPVPGGTTGSARERYLREVNFVDAQLGRLVAAFRERAAGVTAMILVADHGEGLGDHGEAEHGHLLFQSTMHVPLVVTGPGIDASTSSDTAVSTRRVYHTILDFAGLGGEHSLRGAAGNVADVVLGEAMKPFLEYGWQPQVMAVAGRYKSILAGPVETYDLSTDPGETKNLGSAASVPAGMRKALEDYPVASPDAARAPAALDEDARRRLAALGYVSGGVAPVGGEDAPRPADMTMLLAALDAASGLFVQKRYAEVIPLLQQILAQDPNNLVAVLRLAVAHSSLGHEQQAETAFQRATAMAPNSQDVRTYLGLHYARIGAYDRAAALLEAVVAQSPDRVTAVEGLAGVRVQQGEAAMEAGQTDAAISAFERARALQPANFAHDLDLGVLYLASRRFDDSRQALDRVLASQPDDAMALFKRAQVSVLLNEPDRTQRIELAKKRADAVTRPLIEREGLFK